MRKSRKEYGGMDQELEQKKRRGQEKKIRTMSRNFGSYKQSKLSETRRKGRYSAAKSSQLSWLDSTKRVYSTISSLLQSIVMLFGILYSGVVLC